MRAGSKEVGSEKSCQLSVLGRLSRRRVGTVHPVRLWKAGPVLEERGFGSIKETTYE